MDEATETGRPRDEGAKIGFSRGIGDEAVRDDVRCWLVRIGTAATGELFVAKLSITGEVFGSWRCPAVVCPEEGGGTVPVNGVASSDGEAETGRVVSVATGIVSGAEIDLVSMIVDDTFVATGIDFGAGMGLVSMIADDGAWTGARLTGIDGK